MAQGSILLFLHERTTKRGMQKQVSSIRLTTCGTSKGSVAGKIVREKLLEKNSNFGPIKAVLMVRDDLTYYHFI